MKHFRWLCVLIMAAWLLPALAAPTIHGPGLHTTPLMLDDESEPGGLMEIYNTRGELIVDVSFDDDWLIHELQLFIEPVSDDLFTEDNGFPIKKDVVDFSKFPHKWEFEGWETASPPDAKTMIVAFSELFGKEEFQWGIPWKHKRTIAVVLHADIVKLDVDGNVIATSDAWGHGDIPVPYSNNGTAFAYEMAHPKKAHFIDSPVAGLRAITKTFMGKTDESGGLDYFPGEWAEFSIGDYRLGEALLDHKVSPLDLIDQSDTDDPRVINMARLLQSLDSEVSPENGILITDAVEVCLNDAMAGLGYDAFDFSSDEQIEAVIQGTIDECIGIVPLVSVDADVAKANLEKTLDSNMFRKNISRTPELGSAKAKLNVMGVWFPALKANGELASFLDDTGATQIGVPYYDADGNWIRTATEAKPLVITYTDADPVTGAHDVWGAISRDDGNTWKRKNLSRMGDRTSFTLADGTPFYGECKKPVFQVKGNKILVAWTSKFAKGGKPRYAINLCDNPDTEEVPTTDPVTGELVCEEYCKGTVEDGTYECEPDYRFDDAYWKDDIWGVSGPQRSHDYTEDGYPEVGEVPYSAVWVARGVVVSQAEIAKGGWWADKVVGDIVWFKPERLTSARRDANQVFMGGADGAGFAIAWQEDPGGLRPGEAKGPGPGWGGATTNHKTDIWYSYVTWSDFARLDENFVAGGDPEHPVQYDDDGNEIDWTNRPKALVPMSLPVRISDNDAVNTDNLLVQLGEDGLPVLDENGDFIPITNTDAISEEADGSHRYGYMLDGLWDWDGDIYYEGEDNSGWTEGAGTLYEFVNQQDEVKRVVITADGRALDGNTGASRPNLFLQTYTKPDGSKSAWAIMAYEETKGMGSGPPEETSEGEEPQDGSGYDPYALVPDEGKNAIYHSFDFQNPDLVSAGTILNLPETDELGEPLYVVEPEYLGSDPIYDGEGNIIGYNPIVNPAAGELITDWKGDPQLAYENARRPRFILQGKSAMGPSGTVLIALYKEGEEGQGRPSDIMARRCMVKDEFGNVMTGNPYDPKNFVPQTETDPRVAVQNVSTVVPGLTWVNPDRDPDAKGDGVKVCDWTQPEEALGYKSSANPYEDARAHRGAIRGDFVIMGYSYTPNWAASRNAHDKYDFYIRRSFDGGETWTTDPALSAEDVVVHTDYFFDPDGISGAELDEEGNDVSEPTKHYTVDTEYAGGGVYEPARNVSLIKNNKVSVIEPRIVAVPGTIKIDGEWTGIPEDKQDPNVFYIAYGTSTNLPFIEKAPEDLFLSFSQDRGTTFVEDTWVVNPDSDGNNAGEEVTAWFRLAKGDPEQGEVQLRMTPNGERFYACWLEEGEEGSDIVFRRLTPVEFPANVAETTTTSVD